MSARLTRYGGPAAVLGGVLYLATFGMVYLIFGVFEGQAGSTRSLTYGSIYVFYTPMYGALALGTLGSYLRQRDRFGSLGKMGSYLTTLGFSLGAAGSATIAALWLTGGGVGAVPQFVTHVLAHALYAVGSILFGIATFRAGVLPKAAAVMVAAGPAWQFVLSLGGVDGSYLLLLPPFAVTALGWMWLGYALIAEGNQGVGSPRAV